MMYRPKGAEKMTYEEFKRIVERTLRKAPNGLTWTQIREKQRALYQRFPANQWVRQMERDIGLVREATKGRIVWKLR